MKNAFLAALLILATAPEPAAANPYTDLTAVARKFDAVRSFLATETNGGRTVTVTYVGPDRWEITRPPMEEMVVGNTLSIKMGGTWRQAPAPPNVGTMTFLMRNPFGGLPIAAHATILSETTGSLNGTPVRIFVFTLHSAPAIRTTLYVGRDDLPIQNVVAAPASTTTVRYTRYNDSSLTVP